jgi:hypothetical protein
MSDERIVRNADLLAIICTYLLHVEKLAYISVNKFIHEGSKLFRYLRLKREFSIQFYEDITFRNKCLSLINNPMRQLNLNLSRCGQLANVSALGHVHTLDLSGCDQLTDVSTLGHVHTLDLSGCDQLTCC